MNTQNKVYTTQFFSPPDDKLAATSQAAITEHQNHEFCKIHKKSLNSQTWHDLNSQKWKKLRASCPPANSHS